MTVNTGQTRSQVMSDTKDSYPDLYLPVVENYKISDKFYGYSDSLSTDNNPMVLVELEGLSYLYGTSIYAVDRVNGTMYSKFDVGYRMISEKATVKPQFRPTSLEDEYTVMQPTYVNTLPGTTSIDTPIAKSTLVTQASQIPSIPIVLSHVKDILEPSSSEQARAAYLERQMHNMNSVRIPLSMPSLEDGTSIEPESLSRRIHDYCEERRDNRKHEWETHKMTLNSIKEKKEKQYQQQSQKERDVYARMLHNLERTRAVVRNSISRASTILAEEHQLTLTTTDFLVIKRKMDKIDQRLDGLYQNWQAEYKEAVTSEECEEIRRFYKPYLEKYESKYRILYQMLQQASKEQTSILPPEEPTSEITPSVAALDDAPALKQKEWKRGEPGEDIP